MGFFILGFFTALGLVYLGAQLELRRQRKRLGVLKGQIDAKYEEQMEHHKRNLLAHHLALAQVKQELKMLGRDVE